MGRAVRVAGRKAEPEPEPVPVAVPEARESREERRRLEKATGEAMIDD